MPCKVKDWASMALEGNVVDGAPQETNVSAGNPGIT